jgi:sigma-E factor negative regulatory protein RseC
VIEERAIVYKVADGTILVQAISPSNCPRCAEGRGCGGGVLARLVTARRPGLQAKSRIANLREGEMVVVGVDESVLIRASLLLWLAPLGSMIAAGAFADRLLDAADILVGAFGIVGLAAGFVWVCWRVGGLDSARFQPMILRRDERVDVVCPRLS